MPCVVESKPSIDNNLNSTHEMKIFSKTKQRYILRKNTRRTLFVSNFVSYKKMAKLQNKKIRIAVKCTVMLMFLLVCLVCCEGEYDFMDHMHCNVFVNNNSSNNDIIFDSLCMKVVLLIIVQTMYSQTRVSCKQQLLHVRVWGPIVIIV